MLFYAELGNFIGRSQEKEEREFRISVLELEEYEIEEYIQNGDIKHPLVEAALYKIKMLDL